VNQTAPRRGRSGMTLLELLVVVAILGLLASAVMPVIGGGDQVRAARAACSSITSLASQAQAQAVGRENPIGLWIEPLSAGQAIDLAIARQPDPYRGDTFDATVSLSGTVSSGTMQLMFSDGGSKVTTLTAPSSPAFASTGDFIQLEGSPDKFALVCPNPPTFDGCKVRLRPEAGQTTANTVWPTPTVEGTGTTWHAFSIIRRPAPAGESISLGSGMAIDLAWSGIGVQRFGQATLDGDGSATGDPADDLAPLGRYAAGQSIAVMFDRVGAVGEIGFFNTTLSPPNATEVRMPLRAPVYLLVGRIDRCGLGYRAAATDDAPGANWQYPDSFWVSIDPKTGMTRCSQCAISDADGPVTTARRSQAGIRSAL